MYAKRIANGILGNCLSTLHAKLAESVKAADDGALSGGHLSLSQLARSVRSAVVVRHRVKRIDRLPGSAPLLAARVDIYRRVAARWLSGLDEVLILIDGSDATTDQRWPLLRASIAVEGRSVTLYEEIHPQKNMETRKSTAGFWPAWKSGCLSAAGQSSSPMPAFTQPGSIGSLRTLGHGSDAFVAKTGAALAEEPSGDAPKFSRTPPAEPSICRGTVCSSSSDRLSARVVQGGRQGASPAHALRPKVLFAGLAQSGSGCA
jgi:hypothetical protein